MDQPAPMPLSCAFPALPAPREVRMVEGTEHPCPYLPGRNARSRAVLVGKMPGDLYHQFMDAGFRRSGRVVYQPVCGSCRACVPIRVPVDRFAPGKAQRRCWRRNQDLEVIVDEPVPTRQKHELYRRYLAERHDGLMSDDWEGFGEFLYDSPVDTLEFCYRDGGGKLLAVGICDLCPRALSSVYFWFDPAEARRGLGTFGAMYEIDFARRRGVGYYYMGFWVDRCPTMQYKTSFRPHELLGPDGIWRPGNPGKPVFRREPASGRRQD